MGFTKRPAGIRRLPPTRHYLGRLLRNFAIATTIIGGGLLIGMTGYHSFGAMSWRESFYFASMILAGEGPPQDPANLSAMQIGHLHLFAGFYALFSGVTFITMVGVLLAPMLHRFLHRFHLEISQDETGGESP
ncbi:MAG: hypothetical protein ABJB95_01320 [Gemmatimonadales bacterium]